MTSILGQAFNFPLRIVVLFPKALYHTTQFKSDVVALNSKAGLENCFYALASLLLPCDSDRYTVNAMRRSSQTDISELTEPSYKMSMMILEKAR